MGSLVRKIALPAFSAALLVVCWSAAVALAQTLYTLDAPASAPYDPTAVVSSGEFPHKLVLSWPPGMPATLSLSSEEQVSFARVLLYLDESLLVIPLKLDTAKQEFTNSFPTPHETLSYQFQLILGTGETVLSPEFTSRVSCKPEIEIKGRGEKAKRRMELLDRLKETSEQSALLDYLQDALSEFRQTEEQE